MPDLDLLLAKAKEFHGEVCPGIVLGTRMTMIGMRELGMEPLKKNRDLIVYVEIDRCMSDAVQAITGCTLGHRTLKYLPYGKFAATFINNSTQDAVRVSGVEKKEFKMKGPEEMKAILKSLMEAPEEELFRTEKVRVRIPERDLPGRPAGRARCERCREDIMDGKEVVHNGATLCGNCAGTSYYEPVE